EDGIRDRTVTGVQTCALPICQVGNDRDAIGALEQPLGNRLVTGVANLLEHLARDEEAPLLACLRMGRIGDAGEQHCREQRRESRADTHGEYPLWSPDCRRWPTGGERTYRR